MAIKIGCDPEFTLVQQGSQRQFHLNRDLSVGTIKPDHCGQVGEFNPNASRHPADVVNNLRQLISKTKEHFGPEYKIIAGGGRELQVSTGGHIHFSSNIITQWDFSSDDYSWGSRGRQDSVLPINSGNKLVLALDGFIGAKLQKLTNGKRYDRSYNILSKLKRKHYRNAEGFEYRSAPSFLVTPQLVEATLATAQRIASLWETKNTCFDEIIARTIPETDDSSPRYTRRGRIRRARQKRVKIKRGEFQLLIPTETNESARYYRNQIRYFISVINNRSFNLGDERLFDYWTAPTVSGNPSVAMAANRAIQLIPCQLKMVHLQDDFENEQVFKVVRFAVSEVKVYPIDNRFIPWSFRLRRDQQLKTDTVYISRNLRPFIKMTRGANFKLRFVDLNSRNGAIESSIFFNRIDSDTEIVNFISSIFEHNVRTRLRRRDSTNV